MPWPPSVSDSTAAVRLDTPRVRRGETHGGTANFCELAAEPSVFQVRTDSLNILRLKAIQNAMHVELLFDIH